MTEAVSRDAPEPPRVARRLTPSRRRVGEWMDDPTLDPAMHAQALGGLERINRLSGAAASLWRTIRRFADELAHPLRIGDLACGAGDVLLGVANLAQREGCPLDPAGYDLSPVALGEAERRAARLDLPVRLAPLDALHDSLPTDRDLLMCSLFMHHLDEAEVVSLLRRMGEAARCGVVVADLERRWLGHLLAAVVPRLITRSPVVHVDAWRSAGAAWTRAEMRDMAERAGLRGATVRPCWPARMILRWAKS